MQKFETILQTPDVHLAVAEDFVVAIWSGDTSVSAVQLVHERFNQLVVSFLDER